MLFTTNLISVTKGIISLLQNPGNTLSVYDIEDGLKESWLQRLSLQYVKSDREHLTFVTPKLSFMSSYFESLARSKFHRQV
ncbi:MAG: hypothetical protein ACKPGT_33635 [Microcystis sp.]|jgi:hypothetical protein|uniref:Uncharacterized protein n=1 Tax=Microcystis aeruginosa PCC 9443 TaxID=1160281 RepID=I4G7X4_MICAE|nr:hypothetical protein [Microcystis aeruginosa]MCZ8188221.1 hypothetical protein [Microcystis sp. LE19-338.1B]MCZ8360996.1 hypothetical protein [Microcystis sp. LE19-388.1G]NCS28367.1 hypothetical protein [Microcystis aeruginosa F13-15]CCI04035.1 conserved hypothetical protein [Microcystis aeruginosa PCC 9443]